MEDRTVIMTTHQPALTELATRTIYLRRGGHLENTPTPEAIEDIDAEATEIEAEAAATTGAAR
jgi:ABC-type lipoprotein export system ATPase subunit